jgi:phenylalanyl-tRNA synthetase alpha chain
MSVGGRPDADLTGANAEPADSPPAVEFTITQRQRLRELGAAPAETERTFAAAADRDAAFKEQERQLTGQAREQLAALRDGERRPQLRRLEAALSAALRDAGFVEVVTPHILSRDAIKKMGIPDDDPLTEQIFWLPGRSCLRPMLAPNLYTVMRRLSKTWRRPFGIFEIGSCFRRDTQGSHHLQEFTMLNLVELGTPLDRRQDRLQELAGVVMTAAGIGEWELQHEESGVYGDTLDVLVGGVEVCSTAMGPHPLDDAWNIHDPWVGLGFGLERLLVVRDEHENIERVARSLTYLDGARLHL